jgi:hypothetical protein
MASGRDFERDAEGGEQDALIGIQTRGDTILRGTTVPPLRGGPTGREGIERSPGTGRERSPPSPVRSSGQDWSALRGAERATGGQMGAPKPRRPEEDRTSPFRAAEGAPPGFMVLAAGPALDLRPVWLGDPRGTPQRMFGKNIDRVRLAPAWSLFVDCAKKDATRQRRRTTSRYGTSVKLPLRASGWRETIGTTPRGTKPRQGRRVQWRAPQCTCSCNRWLRRK